MKLHHFREVVAIAERGSIRAAARHLAMAQPALTRSLAELERELGAPLFERRARGVVATALGQAFIAAPPRSSRKSAAPARKSSNCAASLPAPSPQASPSPPTSPCSPPP